MINLQDIGPGAIVNVHQGNRDHLGVSVTEQDGPGYVGVDEDGTAFTFTADEVTFIPLAAQPNVCTNPECDGDDCPDFAG